MPYSYFTYYYPGVLSLSEIQAEMEKNNIQRLPEKDFYVAVICENLEFDLDLKTHTSELIIAVFKTNVGVASNHNVRIFYSSDRDKKRIRQKGLPL